jgi:hypothetical protein
MNVFTAHYSSHKHNAVRLPTPFPPPQILGSTNNLVPFGILLSLNATLRL